MIQNPVVEETPTRPPGECFSCKATQLSPGRTWFLDTDVDYFDTPSYRIQICNICFDLLANTCGYIKIGEEVEQYRKKISELEGRLNGLRRYRSVIEQLGIDDDHINRLMALDTGNLEAIHDDSDEPGSTERSGEGQDKKRVGGGKKRLPESADDEGVGGLRTTERDQSVNVRI